MHIEPCPRSSLTPLAQPGARPRRVVLVPDEMILVAETSARMDCWQQDVDVDAHPEEDET